MYAKLALASGLLVALPAVALNPSCAPGGNFDLSKWSLQLPSGSQGSPTTISGSKLSGCSGYTDQYFYTDGSTGQLVMKVPGSPASSGCVTTSGSSHCRTEFRESSPSSWSSSSGTHTLTVTMSVPKPDNGGHGTAIGQIFGSDAGKPLAEMYYSQSGEITIGVNQTPAGGSEVVSKVGQVAVGSSFTYILAFVNGKMSVTINGVKTSLSTYSWGTPNCYFKSGDYNQGSVPSEVHISSISVQHS
ncbi:hypothetical protein PT974_04850 [Cladobotryum mycophilum]|uniref:Alginate lyase 2 domain-containing protein n=1 Tax=Cladobotryum mycophilum TaxID=491253 RepID=A0ABR0SQC0_9HYPO